MFSTLNEIVTDEDDRNHDQAYRYIQPDHDKGSRALFRAVHSSLVLIGYSQNAQDTPQQKFPLQIIKTKN